MEGLTKVWEGCFEATGGRNIYSDKHQVSRTGKVGVRVVPQVPG